MSKVVNFQRKYDAASQTSRTSNWLTQSTDANAAIVRPDLIRNRARDLVRNNAWANKAVGVITNNTIGYGIRPQFTSGAKKRAQTLWTQWAETTQCDANGLTDMYGLQQQIMRCMVESGECLVRLRTRKAEDNLAIPMQLQVLEPDFLYEHNDSSLPNGAYINRGIEYDAIGRRVAYYLYKTHPGISGYARYSSDYSRVPANEIIHCFRQDRPGQERGVSWLAPVMITLRELDIFEDAFLNRQKLANLFAAFMYANDVEVAAEELTLNEEITPGSIHVLPENRRMEFSTPPSASDYGPYTLANLKRVAAGLGITYEALTGDLSDVNFSSARMGWQEFGRNVDSWRWQLFIPRVCHRIMDWFVLFGGINVTTDWTPPARVMVDPIRELPPIIDAVRAGLMSLSEALREQGYNPETVLREIASDNALLDELGLVLDTDPRKTSGQGQSQSQTTTDQTQDTQV